MANNAYIEIKDIQKFYPHKDGKLFHELHRGDLSKKEFFGQIIDVLTLLGGDVSDAL